MSTKEDAVVFSSQGEDLLGILHKPPQHSDIGVLVVVGGPQYRIGSHRHFVLLARYLAARGVPVFRFDYRGMGDSGGEMPGFENINSDISSAIDVFTASSPGLSRVVIWGLCDAASAALLYAHMDQRVAGLVLLNPWVRTEQGLARTYLRHYYLKRLFSRDFWAKLGSGKWNARESLSSLLEMVAKLSGRQNVDVGEDPGEAAINVNFLSRMVEGMEQFTGPILFILSLRNDYVADEFRGMVAGSGRFRRLMNTAQVTVRELEGANHTFSKQEWRDMVAHWTYEWFTLKLIDNAQK